MSAQVDELYELGTVEPTVAPMGDTVTSRAPIDNVNAALDFVESCSDRDLAWIITGADFIARQRAGAPVVEGESWCPWRELIRRYPRVRLRWTCLGPRFRGIISWSPTSATIHIDPTVVRSNAEQAKTLTHELIHDERGVYHWTPDERAVEEAEVRRLTAERMASWVRPIARRF